MTKKVIETRTKLLQEKVDVYIEEGYPNGVCFAVNEYDITLVQPYANSLGLEVFVSTCTGQHTTGIGQTHSPRPSLGLRLLKKKEIPKVEEEDWAEDLLPKPNWFVLWVNKLIYWVNKH